MTVDQAKPALPWSAEDLSDNLVRRFERVVALFGSRIAVTDEHETLTYAELNRRANAFAQALRTHGAEPGSGVALLLETGCLFAVAVWAVLKTGAYYVPLDTAFPSTRLSEILESGAATRMVTDRRHAEQARAAVASLRTPPAVLAVDDIPPGDDRIPDVMISPDNRCCIIFTSGSTGKPKGVGQTHRNLMHSTLWYAVPAGLHPDLRMTMFHSASAIAGATAFYGAHLNGAALFPARVSALGVERIPEWLARHRIDVLHVVPTLLRRIAQAMPAGQRLATPRLLRMGGEAIGLSDWRLWRERFMPGSRLLVCLGSTEALNYRQKIHTWEDDEPGDPVPVGDPMPDKDVRLLDEHGRPVPPGAVGEVVVSSPYIFDGYWHQPELTAKLLREDPDRKGWRIFHTGDLARIDASGAMRHLGRNDHLVKVMGYRVHPGDVESVIRLMPGVRDAAVLCAEAADRTTRLDAYIIAPSAGPVTAAAVRQFVGGQLPEHMVPARVTVLDEFPLLPNGKIDRVALARTNEEARTSPVVPARNPVEETLLEIWRKHARAPGIGIMDDVFAQAGADSMTAAAVMADVRALFGRDLPLNTLYRHATVASLAAWLREETRASPAAELVVHAAGSAPPLFGVCGAFGHAMRLLLVGRDLPEEQPLYGLEPPGMDWQAAGCCSLEEMAAWYAARIRGIQAKGPYRMLGTSFGGIVVHAIARHLQRDGHAVSFLGMVDTNPPSCLLPSGMDRAPRHDWAEGMHSDDPLVHAGIRVARQHRAALDRFVLYDRFDGLITYFWCDERHEAGDRDRRSLWQHFATRGLDVVPVPGRHGLFHQEPQRAAIVTALRARL